MCVCGTRSPHAGGTGGGQQVWAPVGLVLVVPRNCPQWGWKGDTETREGEKVEEQGCTFPCLLFILFVFNYTPEHCALSIHN